MILLVSFRFIEQIYKATQLDFGSLTLFHIRRVMGCGRQESGNKGRRAEADAARRCQQHPGEQPAAERIQPV